MKKICASIFLCVVIFAMFAIAEHRQPVDPAEIFTQRLGQVAADSLLNVIRSDYALCVGDTTGLTRTQLFRWKTRIDSIEMDTSFAGKLRSFVEVTGMKIHDVRPCEPIVFFERVDRQTSEMDSAAFVRRSERERERADSIEARRELAELSASVADIMNIPAGMSRRSVRRLLAEGNISVADKAARLQTGYVNFEGIAAIIAFHFDGDDKYIGYEIETEALAATQLDSRVRPWAAQLTTAFESRLGTPPRQNRVSFGDIRQGRLSIVSRWNRGDGVPEVLVGLATDNRLFYAKVMVNY